MNLQKTKIVSTNSVKLIIDNVSIQNVEEYVSWISPLNWISKTAELARRVGIGFELDSIWKDI